MSELKEQMDKFKSVFDATLSEIKQKRDELSVQVKLGSMEAKEEWDALEAKMDELEKRWDRFEDESGMEESAERVTAALETLGDELKAGYKRLKDAL